MPEMKHKYRWFTGSIWDVGVLENFVSFLGEETNEDSLGEKNKKDT